MTLGAADMLATISASKSAQQWACAQTRPARFSRSAAASELRAQAAHIRAATGEGGASAARDSSQTALRQLSDSTVSPPTATSVSTTHPVRETALTDSLSV